MIPARISLDIGLERKSVVSHITRKDSETHVSYRKLPEFKYSHNSRVARVTFITSVANNFQLEAGGKCKPFHAERLYFQKCSMVEHFVLASGQAWKFL